MRDGRRAVVVLLDRTEIGERRRAEDLVVAQRRPVGRGEVHRVGGATGPQQDLPRRLLDGLYPPRPVGTGADAEPAIDLARVGGAQVVAEPLSRGVRVAHVRQGIGTGRHRLRLQGLQRPRARDFGDPLQVLLEGKDTDQEQRPIDVPADLDGPPESRMEDRLHGQDAGGLDLRVGPVDEDARPGPGHEADPSADPRRRPGRDGAAFDRRRKRDQGGGQDGQDEGEQEGTPPHRPTLAAALSSGWTSPGRPTGAPAAPIEGLQPRLGTAEDSL